MPTRDQWQSRIKAVEREYVAMRQAADHFRQAAFDDPAILRANLQHGDIVAAAERLEGTYVIRLFAEFETGARQYWGATGRPIPGPPTCWMDWPHGAGFLIPSGKTRSLVAHYRNGLVHERGEEADTMPIADARHHLCHFFSFLPRRW